jgi:REP element-mobilizing transposase RayT
MTEAHPAAYFITFRCYGTWLHGDERGSVDRRHNAFETPKLPPNPARRHHEEQLLCAPPMSLSPEQRRVVSETIAEVCAHRAWTPHAASVRTNHVHVVLSAECAPERVMNDLKAWSTRRLRDARLIPPQRRVWSRHGSTRYLWTGDDVAAACRYVAEEQD